MKIVEKALFVNVKNQVITGSLEFTAIHHIAVDKNGVDVDFVDVEDVKFMGMSIEGYDGLNKFKSTMKEMGIDINAIMNEACVGIISNDFIKQCKEDFARIA